MYKITIYDACCAAIADGTTFWFTDNLEEFEQKWLPLQARIDVGTIDRYYRSKHGEIVSDWYFDMSELNIVDKDDESKITDEKQFHFVNIEIGLKNAYGCFSTVGFSSLDIEFAVIKYRGEYYLCGKYRGKGCYRVDDEWNRWYKENTKYAQMRFFGNPIAEYTMRTPDWDKRYDSDAYKDFYTNDKDFYKDESIETFVWLPIRKVDEQYKIENISKDDLSFLLRDIVGEAG